jgi:predicted DNA-binding protein
MITLTDLTTAQVKMCERVWACKEMRDFERLLDQLKEDERRMAVTLMELMVQESVEEELEQMTAYPLAESVINRTKKNTKRG